MERDRALPPAAATVAGVPETLEKALERAVTVLSAAKAPVIWGLTRTTTETVREAMALADWLGARVFLDRNDPGGVGAYQDQGKVAATLGEVKNRADLVVYWGIDPMTSHPRHWERYAVTPPGRFIPDGRRGRTVVIVDDQPNSSASLADVFVKVPEDSRVEALASLRMMLRGKGAEIPEGKLDLAMLRDLLDRMILARYGAFFFKPARSDGIGTGWEWIEATRLIRDLNDVTRFVLMGMGSPGNLAGAEAVLSWQGGYLQGVDYRLGYPAAPDRGTTLDDVLRAREVDAVLIVSEQPPDGLTEASRQSLATIPTIAIGPRPLEKWDFRPDIGVATSTPGFDTGGTVIRSDGVVLPLRPVKSATLPEDREILSRLRTGLIERRSGVS